MALAVVRYSYENNCHVAGLLLRYPVRLNFHRPGLVVLDNGHGVERLSLLVLGLDLLNNGHQVWLVLLILSVSKPVRSNRSSKASTLHHDMP